MKSSLLLALVLLCWGSTPIIEKIGLKDASSFAGVTIRSIMITLGLLVITFVTGRTREVFYASGKTIMIFSASGLLAGLIAMMAYFELLKVGETSRLVPVVATYPLVTAILGYLVLGEAFTVHKFIGTMLIVTGIWLVKT